VLYALSWQNPSLSLSVFCPGLALLVAHGLFSYSLVACALHGALLGLLAGAALTLWNHSSLASEGTRVAVPQVTLAPGAVAQALGALGARAGAALQAYNALLTWQAPLDSARAAAYCFLALQLLWLLAPRALLAGYTAAFALVPLYLQHVRAPWLRARSEHVAPAAKRLADLAGAQAEYVQQSGALGKAGVVISAGVLAYVLADYLPYLHILTGACGAEERRARDCPSGASRLTPHAPPFFALAVACSCFALSDLVALLAKAKED